jgi:hypothetical protein
MKTTNSFFFHGWARFGLILLGVVCGCLSASAQLTFTTNSGSIIVTGYSGSPGNLVIPSSTNGYNVTATGANVFKLSTLTTVVIPNTVTTVYTFAFEKTARN